MTMMPQGAAASHSGLEDRLLCGKRSRSAPVTSNLVLKPHLHPTLQIGLSINPRQQPGNWLNLCSTIFDAEIVVLDSEVIPRFQLLQSFRRVHLLSLFVPVLVILSNM
jgi:hypothetical protein